MVLLIALVLTMGIFSLLFFYFSLSLFISYFLSISLIAFVFHGSDKFFALLHLPRISEKSLHILSLLGGSVGTSLAIFFFRHKKSKYSYKKTLFFIFLFQIILLFIYYLIIKI